MNAFDLVAVDHPEQPLARPVDRRLDARHLGPGDHETLGEGLARALGEVGHGLKVGDAPVVDPVPQLLGAVGLLVERLHFGGEFLAVEADEIEAPVAEHLLGRREGLG